MFPLGCLLFYTRRLVISTNTAAKTQGFPRLMLVLTPNYRQHSSSPLLCSLRLLVRQTSHLLPFRNLGALELSRDYSDKTTFAFYFIFFTLVLAV